MSGTPGLVKSKILEDFDLANGVYRDFARAASELIQRILEASGISVHSVTWRPKERSSLVNKLSKPEKQYQSIHEITDLAGMRITTYFSNDVDVVAQIINQQFDIDQENSVDKRITADPAQFGYQSLHFVASMSTARSALVEYQRFSGLKIEIQIRSILQHAWAEIEHDIGYKSASGVPRDVRRRFARVAGLLELADAEFVSIRQSLAAYAGTVVSEIQSAPQTVELDLVSLRALHTIDSACKRLDDLIAEKMNRVLDVDVNSISEDYIGRLQRFSISNVQQLEAVAQREYELIEKFAVYWLARPSRDEWLEEPENRTIGSGIGLFYLIYILLWKKQDADAVRDYFISSRIGNPSEWDQSILELLAFQPE